MTKKPEASPKARAVALGLSVFVGVTGIFSAILAFAVAPMQTDEMNLSGGMQEANQAARSACYWLGVSVLMVGFLALYKGRKSLPLALLCTAVFFAANAGLAFLYVRTW